MRRTHHVREPLDAASAVDLAGKSLEFRDWRRSDPRWATPKPVFEACRSHYVLVDVVQRPMRAPRIISAVSAMPGHEFTIGEPTPAGGSYVCYATKAAACSAAAAHRRGCAPAGAPARRRVDKDVGARAKDGAVRTAAFVLAALAQVPASLVWRPRGSTGAARARRDLRRGARVPFQSTCAF